MPLRGLKLSIEKTNVRCRVGGSGREWQGMTKDFFTGKSKLQLIRGTRADCAKRDLTRQTKITL